MTLTSRAISFTRCAASEWLRRPRRPRRPPGVNVFIRLSDHSAARGGTRLVRGSPHLGRLPNASFDPALVGVAAGHYHAALYVLYGESLMKYTGWYQNGFSAQGLVGTAAGGSVDREQFRRLNLVYFSRL